MLELKEKNFCTGCGVELKEQDRVKEVTRGPALPFGARYVSSDVEMKAMCKGMAAGAFLGFVAFALVAWRVFLSQIGASIGYGIFGAALLAVPSVFVVSRLSDDGKEKLAASFKFIPTDGILYHAVDFLVIKFPILMSSSRPENKNVKPPASGRNRKSPVAKKPSRRKK